MWSLYVDFGTAILFWRYLYTVFQNLCLTIPNSWIQMAFTWNLCQRKVGTSSLACNSTAMEWDSHHITVPFHLPAGIGAENYQSNSCGISSGMADGHSSTCCNEVCELKQSPLSVIRQIDICCMRTCKRFMTACCIYPWTSLVGSKSPFTLSKEKRCNIHC